MSRTLADRLSKAQAEISRRGLDPNAARSRAGGSPFGGGRMGQGQTASRGGAPQPRAARPPTGKLSGREHEFLMDLVPDDEGAPPQRGSINPERKKALHLAVVASDAVRIDIAPNEALDAPLPRTEPMVNQAKQALQRLAKERQISVPKGDYLQTFMSDVMDEIFGYGPLEKVLSNEKISEVMVNGPYIVFVEVGGQLHESGFKFADDDHLEKVIRRIAAPLDRPVDFDHPLLDGRLPDGSRVNAVVRPCSLDGPNLTIRRFAQDKLTIDNLINFKSMSPEMAKFLEALVVSKKNVVISGGTGSGKTTLINCLSGYIPTGDRVVTIEDAAELQLKQRNVVRLETKKRSPNSETEVTIRDCVKNALRMRPERIIVGECRGGECLDMLQAMNTGHDGSMTTVHSNNPRACISRLETLVMMAGADLPIQVVRRQIVDAVHFIVQASRLRDGSRKVTYITEIVRLEGDMPILSDIFRFEDKGDNAAGKVHGYHSATGNRPVCVEDLKQKGFDFPPEYYMQRRPRGFQ